MIHLSFSSRGQKNPDINKFISEAKLLNFQGIEIYNPQHYASMTGHGGALDKYAVAATARILRENALTVPCFDCSADPEMPESENEIYVLIERAYALQCHFIALEFNTQNEESIKIFLDKIIKKVSRRGITILVKTCGIYVDTDRLRTVLDDFACDELGALWDMHQTFRIGNESPDKTIKNLGGYVRHVHLNDSDDEGNYCLMGEGTLPVEEMVRALSSIDYDGFISLKWEPEWTYPLTDCEIVFTHFENYMSRFDSPRGKKAKLYDNASHTGQCVWKKDTLIRETFPQVLDRMVEEFPDQYAFKYTTLDYTRTYKEFRDDVDRFAASLISLGVRRGTKVAVWATNVPAWFISFWATTKIGAVLVTVNTAYKIHEAEYLLRQSDTHTLIMIDHCLDSDYKSIMQTLCPELEHTEEGTPLHSKRLPFLRNVITVGFKMKGCLTFEQAMQRSIIVPVEEVHRMASDVRPGDVCNMQYTSGTTGFPKGVMLTHYNVVNDGKCIGDRMDLSTADRMMIQVPMFHCFGMVLSMTSSMTHGATLCPMPYFSAKNSLACISQEHITCFNGVPTMFIAMFNHPDYRKTDFSHMRTGIMAGAGCPPELMRRAARDDEMHMTGIVSVYGQTESAPGSTMSAWDDPIDVRTETVGYAFPHIECRIVDPETGEDLPDGCSGEFLSRGYNTMKGYYKMPDATAKTVDSEGWLHSGDIACRDEFGNYRITGRIKDMVIRGGENIYPKEIEEFIYTHPAVKDVQVIGVPDEKYGEELWASVILHEAGSVTEKELEKYMRASLARHKVPKYIVFTDSFPMNAAGKVLKYKMREEAAKYLQENRH